MGPLHVYTVGVRWTGAGETGTTSYTTYSRDHEVQVPGRPVLLGSADPAFRGDPSRHTPEDLLVAALAQCHMLWFLHLAAQDGVVVVGYADEAVGRMRVESAGAGQFTEVLLHPRVTIRTTTRADARGDGSDAGTGTGPTAIGTGTGAVGDSGAEAGSGTGTGTTATRVTDRGSDAHLADLHRRAHEHCFIARSVNFPVRHEPVTHRVA